MSGSKNYRAAKLFTTGRTYALHSIFTEKERIHTRREMHFSPTAAYLFAHGLDDTRQAVGTNVRMGIT